MGILWFIVFCVFILGFFLDWIEICFIILPLIAPVVVDLDFRVEGYGVVTDPKMVWFLLVLAMTLQTSFLTPPVGFALFYLKGIVPPEVTLADIYRGVIPFVIIQMIGVFVVSIWPEVVTWLPAVAYR
jgi:TRAP-type mannitol/chloroaromatic compound transport system permease large subunit